MIEYHEFRPSIITDFPTLSAIYINELVSDEWIVQELEMWMNEKEVEVTVSNEVKIQQHGFDKRSFRHRI